MINPSVAIIIVNWNSYSFTFDCITSLKKCNYPNFKIILVDNGSTDFSIEKLSKDFKEIDISKAQRGDILYYKSDKADFEGTLGVCLGDKVMFNWIQGINLRLKEDCITAWRVE